MKIKLLGKEAEVKTEIVVIAVSVLALLGMLTGYIFFSDVGDIIIEGGGENGQDAANMPGKVIEVQNGADKDGTGTVEGNNGTAITTGISLSNGVTPLSGSGYATVGETGNIEEGQALESAQVERIKVYVVGCVYRPGIVTIERGGLICDAVREAGGLTENADAGNINMVYSLNENVMLYIKSKEETDGFGDGADICIDSGSGAEVIGNGEDTEGGAVRPVLVNINTASIDELDTLPGIGEATAKDIIAFRDKHDGFRTIEDIMKVPRIKENRFESIRDYITVD